PAGGREGVRYFLTVGRDPGFGKASLPGSGRQAIRCFSRIPLLFAGGTSVPTGLYRPAVGTEVPSTTAFDTQPARRFSEHRPLAPNPLPASLLRITALAPTCGRVGPRSTQDRKRTRLNSSH